jgi:FHS family L-fucose permease-like MFS transporter
LAGIILAQQLILKNLNPATIEERRVMAPDALKAIVHNELFWVCVPYVGLCAIAALIWFMFFFSKPTEFDKVEGDSTSIKEVLTILFHSPKWYLGVVAQVFYVGVQIAAWTWMNVYCQKELGVTPAVAANYYLIALCLFIACRWICTFLMKYFDPAKMMALFAFFAIMSSLGVIYIKSDVLFTIGALPFSGNVLCLCAMSGFMSLMFPTIYGIGLAGIDPKAHKLGAAGLIMAIVGGALLTPWMATIIDRPGFWSCLVSMFDSTIDQNLNASSMSLRASFFVPMICFAVVFVYAMIFRTKKKV